MGRVVGIILMLGIRWIVIAPTRHKWFFLTLGRMILYGRMGSMVAAIGRSGLTFESNSVATRVHLACLYPTLTYLELVGIVIVVTFSLALQLFTCFPVLRRELNLSSLAVFLQNDVETAPGSLSGSGCLDISSAGRQAARQTVRAAAIPEAPQL